jgi:transcription initiation factor TFIIIB Brf1 subunit/transcription initiation factor TFIIB
MKENVEVSDFTSITSDGNYNVLSNGVRCIGANAYRYQSILRSNSNSSESNYENLLNAVLFGHNKIIKNINIPKEVLLAVADQYRHIRRSGNVARGTIFKAMLASLTYYECLKHKISFKPSAIYRWFEIDPSTYSKGDKKIRELLDYGHLDIDIRSINAEESYVFTYAASLNISENHTECLIELLKFVISKKIINPNAKSSTRALAIISFYITAIKHTMSSKDFEEHFKCNFGSVRTLSLDMIQKFDLIRPILIEYEIPYDGINPQTKRVIKRKVKKGSRIAL